jgi:GNAT superfamily N-acetyltransferase
VSDRPTSDAPAPALCELADGNRILIRPLGPRDAEHLTDGFERLSHRSRRRRFLTAIQHLTRKQLDYLTNPDLESHLALGAALVGSDDDQAQGIGVARCVRLDRADDLAEVAAAVADEWQGRGVGKLLLQHLARWARRKGVGRWQATMLVDNPAALRLMTGLGPIVSRLSVGAGAIEVVCELDSARLGF